MSKSPSLHFGFSEAIILAGAPAYAYAVAFLYELGYALHFRFPIALIQINITTVLISLGALVSAGIFFWFGGEVVSVIWPSGKSAFAENIRKSIRLLFLLIAAAVLGRSWNTLFSTGAIVFGIFFLLDFVFPLLTQRNVKGYFNKLEAQEEHERSLTFMSDRLVKIVGLSNFRTVLILILILGLSWFAGLGQARSNSHFRVVTGNSNVVVLRIYGGKMIAAEFDPSSKTLSPEIQVIPMDKKLKLRREMLGPLKPATDTQEAESKVSRISRECE